MEARGQKPAEASSQFSLDFENAKRHLLPFLKALFIVAKKIYINNPVKQLSLKYIIDPGTVHLYDNQPSVFDSVNLKLQFNFSLATVMK